MTDVELEQAIETARLQRRRRALVQVVIYVLLIGCSVTTTLAVQAQRSTAEQRDANAATAQTYAGQLDQAGITPAVDPEVIQGDPGAAGEQGDTGPAGPAGEDGQDGQDGADAPPLTGAQVQRAVDAYCSDGSCVGRVTQAQVQAALETYCGRDGVCRGADGQPGAAGAAGADGDTGPQGPQGPPPTAAQIAAALEAYCAGGACRGPQGEPGATGAQGDPGTPGRGIDALDCSSLTPLELTVTYSDGTTDTLSCGP